MSTRNHPNPAPTPLAPAASVALAQSRPDVQPASLAALVIDTAVRLGVTDWIIAPGSRSAPLTAALAGRSDITTRAIYDERSAAHVALGLAQQLRVPVGLVCTSGTAALNFGPALAEAFYQGVPLLAITADRPPEWIDQQDNQALHQNGLYGRHVRASFTLPVDDGHPDTRRHAVRIVSDALQAALAQPPGPAHINAPLREPLYARASEPVVRPAHVAVAVPVRSSIADEAWAPLLAAWAEAERILIVGGPHAPDDELTTALTTLAADGRVAVIGEITANIACADATLQRWDTALGTRDASTLDALRPDLVISFGGAVTSRGLKLLLRNRPPHHFWRVGAGLPAPDTYQANTLVLPLAAGAFMAGLTEHVAPAGHVRGGYQDTWRTLVATASGAVDALLDDAPFGEFAAMRTLLAHVPEGATLQIGNSMPIRYAALLGVAPGHAPSGVYANRGVSGIDGCVSTAVGAALARPDRLTLLIVGDMAFFYDRNGLWHRHVPPNLRIALLNNHGGGIFDVIDGPDTLPEEVLRDFFLTPQPLTARHTAADHGLAYEFATSAAALQNALPAFLAPSNRAALLEIETDMATNSAIFRAYRTCMATRTRA